MNTRYALPASLKLVRQRSQRKIFRLSAAALMMAGLLANIAGIGLNLPGGAAAAQCGHDGGPKFAVNLDQWADAKLKWQNGDLNRNNSAYQEGESVPFRLE